MIKPRHTVGNTLYDDERIHTLDWGTENSDIFSVKHQHFAIFLVALSLIPSKWNLAGDDKKRLLCMHKLHHVFLFNS